MAKSTPKSVMIVDDNEIVRRSLRNLFKKSGEWAVCAEAENGRDALDKAKIYHPEFIVLDFCMPTMDGLEVAPKLKEISPDASIVMLTAFKDKSIEEKAYKAGISWVLSKTTDNISKVLEFGRILRRPAAPLESAVSWNQNRIHARPQAKAGD
jgi:DNA-binding NarL/FixJ family response regulator